MLFAVQVLVLSLVCFSFFCECFPHRRLQQVETVSDVDQSIYMYNRERAGLPTRLGADVRTVGDQVVLFGVMTVIGSEASLTQGGLERHFGKRGWCWNWNWNWEPLLALTQGLEDGKGRAYVKINDGGTGRVG